MHLHLIDHYLKMKSPIHRLDGRIKLIATLTFILCCSLLPTNAWPAFILCLSILVSIILLSDLEIIYVLKRSALALPFLLTALPLVFQPAQSPLYQFHITNINITISQAGLDRFISIGMKSWLSIIAAILLASTTSFTEILLSLRSLHTPRMLVAIVGLMLRYLLLMVEEVDRLMRARLSRSSRSSSTQRRTGGGLVWRAGVTGGMAGSLFVRSLERSERVYNAMLSRGYDGEIRSINEPPIGGKAIIGLTSFISILVALVIFSTWL